MESTLAISFSPGQLALIVLVLGSLVWWGFVRLIGGMDKQFDALGNQLSEIPKNHPTRHELTLAIGGVNQRIDDLRDMTAKKLTGEDQ